VTVASSTLGKGQTAGVLFDFDGTIGRSLYHWAEAIRSALAAHGVSLTHDDVVSQCFATSLDHLVRTYNIPCAVTLGERIWSEINETIHSIELFDGVVDAVNALRQAGFKTGIVTNSRRRIVQPVLELHGIGSLFDAIIGVEDVTNPKPHAEPILLALSRMGVATDGSWMIGDSDVDILAGRNAGVHTIGFAPHDNHAYSPRHRLDTVQPRHLIDSYQSLVSIITGAV